MVFYQSAREDMEEAGIDQLDFVYVCGDAYVDHPSFGHAIISRLIGSTWLYSRYHCTAGLG